MRRLTMYLGKLICRNKFLYYLLNYTWGLVYTIMGYLLMLLLIPFGKIKRSFYSNLCFEFYGWFPLKGFGFSLGTVFFTTKDPAGYLVIHEFGHTIQNAIFGPLTLFVVTIPSMLRFWYRRIYERVTKSFYKPPYESIWFEGTASELGYIFIFGIDV